MCRGYFARVIFLKEKWGLRSGCADKDLKSQGCDLVRTHGKMIPQTWRRWPGGLAL